MITTEKSHICTKKGDRVFALLLDEFGNTVVIRKLSYDPMINLLPGGYVLDGESLQGAVIRLVREKTGILLSSEQIMFLTNQYSGQTCSDYRVFACLVENYSNLFKEPLKIGNEFIQPIVITSDQIQSIKLSVWHHVLFEAAKEVLRRKH